MRAWETFLKVKGWTSEYESVTNFLNHYKRKIASESTKDLVCDSLMALCKFSGKSPDELAMLSSEEASKIVQAHIDELANRGLSIRTVNVVLAYLKTFFKVNGFKGDRTLEVERYHQPSRYRKRIEYIPTPDEIYRMAYSAGSLRNKAMIFALYTSGLRNSTLRALLYGDVRGELLRFEVVRVSVTPEMKRVDAGACKGNIPYYSFISKEAVQALREYISQREKLYRGIDADEPLFASTSTNVPLKTRKYTLVKKRSLNEIVKRAARKAGIVKWKNVFPHCLRKAFESALRNAGLDIKDQEFLMGHILPGPQDTYYDKTKIKTLRSKYSKVNFFPDRGYSTDEARKRQLMDMIQVWGFPDDKIKRIEEALAKYEHVDDALDEIKKLSLKANKEEESADEMGRKTGESVFKKREVRIVKGEKKLLQSLNHNWDLIRELSDQRFIVTRQNEFS